MLRITILRITALRITALRITATRGMVKNVWRPIGSDHGCAKRSPPAAARASRALQISRSKVSSNSFRQVTTGGWYGGAPGGAMSSASFYIVSAAQPGMVATCIASFPMGHDF